MLTALSTGHDGSCAPSTRARRRGPATDRGARADVGRRLPHAAIREQVADAFDLVVCQARCSDGDRRVVAVAEVIRVAVARQRGSSTRGVTESRTGSPRSARAWRRGSRRRRERAGGVGTARGAAGGATGAGGAVGSANCGTGRATGAGGAVGSANCATGRATGPGGAVGSANCAGWGSREIGRAGVARGAVARASSGSAESWSPTARVSRRVVARRSRRGVVTIPPASWKSDHATRVSSGRTAVVDNSTLARGAAGRWR